MQEIDINELNEVRAKLMQLSTANVHRLSEHCGVPFGTIDKFRRGLSFDPRYGSVMPLIRALKRSKQWEK